MKLIILDFDGTLADTRSLIIRTMQQVIAELQLPPRSDAACASVIGLPLSQTFSTIIPMDDDMAQRCADTYHRFFDQNNTPGAVTLFDGVRPTLDELHRRGILLTVASSRSKGSLDDYLHGLGIAKYMQMVIAADDVTHAKPHPEPVLRTLQSLNIEAEEALVVGDTAFDITMGRRAGCSTCGVTYGNGTAEQLQEAGAEHLIDRFSDLKNIVF